MKKVIIPILTLILGSLIFISCEEPTNNGNNNNPSSVYDQTEMLNNYANNIIIPATENFKSKATNLNIAVNDFLITPVVDNLITLRNSFASTYIAFEQTTPFSFMDIAQIPGTSSYYAQRLNGIPLCESTNPFNIAGGLPCQNGVDDQILAGNIDPSTNGVSAIGLPAIEYLIYGLENLDDANLVLKYGDNDANKNRRAYLKNLCKYVLDLSTQQLEGWNGEYKNKFLNSTGNDEGSSLSSFTNSMIKDFESVLRNQKFRIPIELNNGRFVEGYYTKNGAALASIHLQTQLDFFKGTTFDGKDGEGLYNNLIAIKAGQTSAGSLLADDIVTQYQNIKTALDKVKDPLSEKVDSNATEVAEVYSQMQNLIPLLKAEMAPALGVKISYVDSDGD